MLFTDLSSKMGQVPTHGAVVASTMMAQSDMWTLGRASHQDCGKECSLVAMWCLSGDFGGQRADREPQVDDS
jgi:hypothetical protein